MGLSHHYTDLNTTSVFNNGKNLSFQQHQHNHSFHLAYNAHSIAWEYYQQNYD